MQWTSKLSWLMAWLGGTCKGRSSTQRLRRCPDIWTTTTAESECPQPAASWDPCSCSPNSYQVHRSVVRGRIPTGSAGTTTLSQNRRLQQRDWWGVWRRGHWHDWAGFCLSTRRGCRYRFHHNKKGQRQCTVATGQDDHGQLQADIGPGDMRQRPESQETGIGKGPAQTTG